MFIIEKYYLFQIIMMTNSPNANLIEAMKDKLPVKGKLADMLMDTLYIGKEADGNEKNTRKRDLIWQIHGIPPFRRTDRNCPNL